MPARPMPISSSIARAALWARSLFAGAVTAAGAAAGVELCGATTGLVPASVAVEESLVSDPGRLTLDDPLLAAPAPAVDPVPCAGMPVAPPFTGAGGGGTAIVLVMVSEAASGFARSREKGWVVSAGAGVPTPGISSVTTGTIARLS